jgi:hypothetical protein
MAATPSVKPEDVLAALLATVHRRDKAEKLKKLHELCSNEYARRQGLRDLSPLNMSKVAESNGLFKARTIYNAQSKDYRTLLVAWDAYNGPHASSVTKQQAHTPEKYGFLKQIEDPVIRSLCHLGLIERDKIKAELNMLKSRMEVIVDMRPSNYSRSEPTSNVPNVEKRLRLTDSEDRALRSAIDSKFLSGRQWALGEAGEILDRNNRFVFLPGFATAILLFITSSLALRFVKT